MEIVAAGPADHADLTSRAGPELGRIVARVHAELGDSFQAVLQAECGRNFPVQIAGGGVDDGAGFDAVKTDSIFLIGPPAETDVIEASATCGLRSRRQQVELRKLAAVQ